MYYHKKAESVLEQLNITKYYIKPSFRVWTRFDGVRYKDWDCIELQESDKEVLIKYLEETANTKLFIKGEFGSSEYEPAVVHDNMLYRYTDYGIEIGSKSRLKNVDVWNHKPRTIDVF